MRSPSTTSAGSSERTDAGAVMCRTGPSSSLIPSNVETRSQTVAGGAERRDSMLHGAHGEYLPPPMIYDKDADLSKLDGKTVAILGYGSQGHAHALNLKDSGVDVVVGLRDGSASADKARADGLRVASVADAASEGDVVMVLLPDERQAAVWEAEIADGIAPGNLLMFAHGFSIHFEQIDPGPEVDVGMVAPKGPGHLVRRQFVEGNGVPGLIAIHRDASGQARDAVLAYAKGIGCTRAGVIETTFKDETETDLFGEQAVLCGGVSELVRAGYETLVEAGYDPRLAYFECLHELKLIVDLMYEKGITGMRYSISNTAEYGDLTRGKRVIGDPTREAMKKILGRHPVGRVRARVDRREQRRAGELPAHARRAAEPPDRARGQGAALDDGLDRPGLLMADPYVKQYLMTAGPTPLPPAVSQVMAEPMLYHRAPAFIEVYARVPRAAQAACSRPRTRSRSSPRRAAAGWSRRSPTWCAPASPRWSRAAASSASAGRSSATPTGPRRSTGRPSGAARSTPPSSTRRLAEHDGVEVVFTTLSETSTGVVNDMRELTEVAHRHGALIAVDAVSGHRRGPAAAGRVGRGRGRGGLAEGADGPPGLGFASANEAALERAAAAPGRRYYFDWERTVKGQRKDPPDSPFTPAVGLVCALDVALGLIAEEGLEQVYERHRLLGRATREAARALELDTLGEADENANVVTAIALPDVDRRGEGAEADARPLRHHDRGRPGPAEGQDRPHRPLRLLRRLRHRRDDRRRSR